MFSTQNYSTVEKIPINGAHLSHIFLSPAELGKYWQVVIDALESWENKTVDYYIYGIRFVALIIPIFPGLAEVHETRHTTYMQMKLIYQGYKDWKQKRR